MWLEHNAILKFRGLLRQGGLDCMGNVRTKHKGETHSAFFWHQQSHLFNSDRIISSYKEKSFALYGNLKAHASCSKDYFELNCCNDILPSIVIGRSEMGMSKGQMGF